jgi:cytidylate kinase
MKILIFGASGSGATTLGRELAITLGYVHLDSDEYYWKLTEPPYQEKIPREERIRRLTEDFSNNQNVVLSGSLVSWGPYWHTAFDLAVFLYLPPAIRMARLEIREAERNKNRAKTALTEAITREFLDYVRQYDEPDFTGRSLTVHNQWIKLLGCPVLRIERDIPLTEKVDWVQNKIQQLKS